MENLSKNTASGQSATYPVMFTGSETSASIGDSQHNSFSLSGSEDERAGSVAQYGSVLLDMVSGTAHWSPEAPRRAITPDRQNMVFQGRARHCECSAEGHGGNNHVLYLQPLMGV